MKNIILVLIISLLASCASGPRPPKPPAEVIDIPRSVYKTVAERKLEIQAKYAGEKPCINEWSEKDRKEFARLNTMLNDR